ncbi:homoprotocatechuate degradation operon regulator, HpaR [compost metagenome]|uniref:MarR family winged helix-turn-helix transcriptional regulator n=1 Tax=unclassified Cupriavidus TaxID=2640874 RepID=UPI000E2F940E|nr:MULTISPECIES: MarR family transcriptional regulator [unclassified Cupriavidus]BDB26291.1 MarR family transcriptional regulator [Cupriavidus sp. P-10]GLC91005.1 MarR family transcriptional regulator [Cupriavidus sp. TA19]
MTTYDYVDQFLAEWRSARPDLELQHADLLIRVIRLGGVLERELGKLSQAYGISSGQFQVLAALRRRYPQTASPSDLSRIAILTTGTMTVLLDRLEDKGLVRRLRDPNDRRRIEVELSDAGKDLIDRALDERIARLNALTATLDAKECSAATRALRHLLGVVDDPAAPGN